MCLVNAAERRHSRKCSSTSDYAICNNWHPGAVCQISARQPPACLNLSSQLTGMQDPSMPITHDQAVVKCASERMFPQSQTNNVSVKLNIDGGLTMNIKKMQVAFKKITIGVALSSLMTMSVLP